MRIFISLTLAVLSLSFLCCTPSKTLSGLDPKDFATDSTALYVLKGPSGMEACITNYGARLVSLMVPSSDGSLKDVVLGAKDIATYVSIPSSYGATIGQYAGRIAKGHFKLAGKDYQLVCNNNGNSLHGGPNNWRNCCFEFVESTANSLHLRVFSPDGKFGFPGDVTMDVTYTLTANSLDIFYEAATTDTTVINFTNHSFFNLSGDSRSTVLDHELYIAADCYAPTDDSQIPTGELLPVEGTPFDFRVPKLIGKDITTPDHQIEICGGYDQSFILSSAKGQPAAVLSCPTTGIKMTVFTDEPVIQCFTANSANQQFIGKNGQPFVDRGAVCLEAQHLPDSPNHPEFPSTVLAPGKKLTSTTRYVFGLL